jgi:hypothetical protein
MDGRMHMESALRAESLQRFDVLASTDGGDRPILPAASLVYLDGCLFDRGGAVLLGALRSFAWPTGAVVAVGGGEKAAHLARVARSVGVPVGGVAQMVASCEEMNANVVVALLADTGAAWLPRDHVWDIPFLISQGVIPVLLACPPYSYWETPSDDDLPEHGSRFGARRLREGLGIGGYEEVCVCGACS